MIGIQAGAVSFLDEGTEKVLDGFQEMAAINTLFLATFTYGRGIAGRQPRGNLLPDHGKQEYDDNFRGGNFATPHPSYYRNTSIVPEKAPDHGAYDVIADLLPAARRRKIKLICWFEDVFRRDVPGFDRAVEIDVHGHPSGLACPRNPNTRNFWLGLVEDYLRSYDVDGLMWGSERQGPRRAVVAKVLGDEAGQPARRWAGNSRAEAGVTVFALIRDSSICSGEPDSSKNNRRCKMEPVRPDGRYALCGFRRRPVFELTAVLTLRGMRET